MKMRMTNRERSKIVEILRCAAWLAIDEDKPSPIFAAIESLGCDLSNPIYDLAYEAERTVLVEVVEAEPRAASLLEAALRIEEGWNP